MEREIDLKEISDGRLYSSSDMVKADCGDCKGCSACCQGMGSSILLDPYDIYRLSTGTGLTFEDLLKGRIELNMSDGLILPNLKMAGEKSLFFLKWRRQMLRSSIQTGILPSVPFRETL